MRLLALLVVLSISALAACSTGRSGGGTGGSGHACDQPDYFCTCTCEGEMVTFDLGGISECFMQGEPCVDAGTASVDGGDGGSDMGTGGAVPVYESCVSEFGGCE